MKWKHENVNYFWQKQESIFDIKINSNVKTNKSCTKYVSIKIYNVYTKNRQLNYTENGKLKNAWDQKEIR